MQAFFPSPSTGRLRIIANLECGDSSYYTDVDDESGWSDNHIKQWSRLEMWIDPQFDPNFVRYDFVNNDTEFPEGEWYYKMAEPGEVKQFEFVTRTTHTTGQMVLLNIGIFDEQDIQANDMQIYAEIKHNWILRKFDITGV